MDEINIYKAINKYIIETHLRWSVNTQVFTQLIIDNNCGKVSKKTYGVFIVGAKPIESLAEVAGWVNDYKSLPALKRLLYYFKAMQAYPKIN